MQVMPKIPFTNVRDYLMIVLGLICYSFGFSAFILPEKIVIGGMTGVASLIYYLTSIPVGLTVFVLNIILLLIAFKSVSKTFVIRTIFGSGVLSLLISIMQPWFVEPIVKGQPFMNTVIGAMFCGFGIGMVFVHNGSTGGTDIIAAMVNKHSNISFGRMMLYCDMLIISSSYLLPENEGFEKIVYGFVVMLIVSNLCDLVINSSRQSVQFMIFSQKYEEIANAINSEVHRGVTVLNGNGWYSKQPMQVLVVLARQGDSVTIFRIIKSIDANAFISQAKVEGVYGEGFDQMK